MDILYIQYIVIEYHRATLFYVWYTAFKMVRWDNMPKEPWNWSKAVSDETSKTYKVARLERLFGSFMTTIVIDIYRVYRAYTLWLFNIAMENGPFTDGLPIKNGDFPWLC